MDNELWFTRSVAQVLRDHVLAIAHVLGVDSAPSLVEAW
jgi:hypothetical protein